MEVNEKKNLAADLMIIYREKNIVRAILNSMITDNQLDQMNFQNSTILIGETEEVKYFKDKIKMLEEARKHLDKNY